MYNLDYRLAIMTFHSSELKWVRAYQDEIRIYLDEYNKEP